MHLTKQSQVECSTQGQLILQMHVCAMLMMYMFVLLARSPVFSHLSSSLQGLSTIRAFRVQQRFQQMFDEYQDLHSGENKNLYFS